MLLEKRFYSCSFWDSKDHQEDVSVSLSHTHTHMYTTTSIHACHTVKELEKERAQNLAYHWAFEPKSKLMLIPWMSWEKKCRREREWKMYLLR